MVTQPPQFSPKQIASALGVSESSVKRWCDRGAIETVRTVGGHRKITQDGLQAFISETGRSLQDPQLVGLRTSVAAPIPGSDEPCKQKFREALVRGDEVTCRKVLFDRVKEAGSHAEVAESLITDAMRGIGEAWDCRQLDAYQERQGCNICLRLINELRADLPALPESAPVAIGGAPEGDPYQLPTAMVELALRETGWNAISLGNNLPMDSYLQAAHDWSPRLVWLSVSSVATPEMFIREQNRLAAGLGEDVALLIGGRALCDKTRPRLRYTAHCDCIRNVVDLAGLMLL
ncbi:MAG: helix-turn-helix domain-containing protein [Rubripirellula sp.]